MIHSHAHTIDLEVKDHEAASDDEGLSFGKNNDDVLFGDQIDLNIHHKYSTDAFQPETNEIFDERDDWISYPRQLREDKVMSGERQDNEKDATHLLQMFNPKMHEKSNIKNYESLEIYGVDNIVNDPQMKESRRSAQGDYDLSEQGGIAILVQELNFKNDGKSTIKEQEPWERPDSPPIKEIYIPTNHTFSFGFHVDPVVTVETQGVARVRTKKDNDTRIQSIIKRGKERFFSRRRRKKRMVTE